MPTIKATFFVLALLLLITHASASTSVYHESFSCQDAGYEGISSSSYAYGSETNYIEGDISGYVRWKTETWFGTPDNAYATFGLQNVDTGAKYNLVTRQNVWGTWNSSFSKPAMPAGNYRQYLYVYAYEYGDDSRGMKATLLNETVVVDSGLDIPDLPSSNGDIYFTEDQYTISETPRLYASVLYDYENIGYHVNPTEPLYFWNTYLQLRFYQVDYYEGSFYTLDYDPFESQIIATESDGELLFWDGSSLVSYGVGTSEPYDLVNHPEGKIVKAQLVEVTDSYAGIPGVYSRFIGSEESVIDTAYTICLDASGNYDVPDTEPEEPEEPGNSEDPGDPGNTTFPIDDPVIPPVNDTPYEPPESSGGSNESLNTTFLTGYYGTVDDVFQPLNSSVSGLLSFSVSPVTNLGTAIDGLGTYLDSSLTTALYYIDPVGIILDAVFYAIPDKVEFLFQLSLILTGVLVALRWK